MKDSDIDAQLRALYYDEASPAAYGGIQKLYRHAHQSGIKNVTLAKVRQFLSKQQSYTLHRPVRHRFLRNKTYVRGIDSQWQADLADMQSLARANGGYKYLLTCIDVFSKFAWVAPVKDKSGDSVAKAFSIVLSKAAPRVPEKLQTDKGKEFFNKAFQDIMRRHKIHHFASNSDMKAAVVERYNRTLKSRLWNYFTANKTTRYIDSLQTHVDAYNSTIHRTTGMAPRDVKPHDEPRLWKRMFMHNDDSNSMPRKSILARGKLVRLSKWKGAFDKGYIPNWTREHFRISKREGHPQTDVYRIEDAAGEPVEGCFYRSEVQPIGRNDFEVEKVIKRRVVDGRTEHFVKWKGWSDAFNTWIDPQQTYSEND